MVEIVRGDTLILEAIAEDDITDFKIRCEIYNDDISVKKATANSGGSDSQIKIIDPTNGVFEIRCEPSETAEFTDPMHIEIEFETPLGDIYTVFQDLIKVKNEKITWKTP